MSSSTNQAFSSESLPAAGATPEAQTITAEMSAEMDAAMRQAMSAKPPPPKDAGEKRPAIRGPRVVQAGREHRNGKVVSVGPSDLFLEFGPKELGVVPKAQWPEEQTPKVGDSLEVVVDRYEPTESIFLCSRPGSVQKADWEGLEPGQVVDARVTGVNKGGLELEVAGHAAFMPAGQVSLDRIADLSVFVGEKMTCLVERVDRRGRGNIVLSRREILAREREEKASKLKGSLHEGQVVEGVVRKIMPFGAFVDLGGVDGLIHLTDLAHERVNHGERAVARHVKEGEAVRVQVLKLDLENNRISLGLKQVQADPFALATNEIAEGAEVSGRVARLAEFGAFVELAAGVEGLVHISEMAHRRVGKPDEVVKPNEVVRCKVLKIDKETRRISLSIKALVEAPPDPRAQARKARDAELQQRYDEINKETPALRRMREKAKGMKFKGGLG